MALPSSFLLDTSKVLGGKVPTNQTKPIKELGALTGNMQTGKVICKFSAKDGRQARARRVGYGDTTNGSSHRNARKSNFSNRVFGACCATNRHGSLGHNHRLHWNSQLLPGMCWAGTNDADISWFFTEIKHVEKLEENPTKEVD